MQDEEALLKADFRLFVFVIWQHLGLPEPTALQYDIAAYLQHGPKRRIIEAFRGVGKSWLTAAYVLWRLYCDPNERILVVSASKDRADAFATFVRRLILEVPLLQHLKPNKQAGDRDSALLFDVAPAMPHQSPSVKAAGITGQITGSRASIIVVDDVEVPKNSLTQVMRDRLAELVKEFDAILMTEADMRAIGMPRPPEIIFLGTPQCEMSLYNVLPQRGFSLRVWPARCPSEAEAVAYGERLAPIVTARIGETVGMTDRGAPTDPQRFTDLDLLEREGSYGRSGFSMQFMLNTSVSDADRYPLKMADLIVMGLDLKQGPVSLAWGSSAPQVVNDIPCVGLQGDRLHRPMFVSDKFLPWQGVVMAIDPSGRGGDELGYAIVAMLNGWLYLLQLKGLVGGYKDENLQKLADEAKRYGVQHIIIEENFGDGMFSKLLTPFLVRTYPCTTEEVKHSIQKEKRIIDTLEPVMNQHRLVVDEKLVVADAENYNGYGEDRFRDYMLFHQMTRITKERGALAKDDRIDVLAIAVAYWVEQMDADVKKAEEEHKQSLLEQELSTFHEHVIGYTPVSNNWNALPGR
jgi:hypothetical protein